MPAVDLSPIAELNRDIQRQKSKIKNDFDTRWIASREEEQNFWTEGLVKNRSKINDTLELLAEENRRIQTLDPNSSETELAKKIWLQYYKIYTESQKSFQLSKTLFSVGYVHERLFNTTEECYNLSLYGFLQQQLMAHTVNPEKLDQWSEFVGKIRIKSNDADSDLKELNKQLVDSAERVRTPEDQKKVDEFCQIRDQITRAQETSIDGLTHMEGWIAQKRNVIALYQNHQAKQNSKNPSPNSSPGRDRRRGGMRR